MLQISEEDEYTPQQTLVLLPICQQHKCTYSRRTSDISHAVTSHPRRHWQPMDPVTALHMQIPRYHDKLVDVLGLCSEMLGVLPKKELLANPLEIYLPVAAAWIETLAVQMHYWDDKYHKYHKDSGIGVSGRGRSLRKGRGGFHERWSFWRERFGKLSRGEIEEDFS